MRFPILLQSSPWLLGLCLLIGIAYAWLLYDKKAEWGRRVNRALAATRGVLVASLVFLLLDPIFRTSSSTIEKPVWALLVDNSESVSPNKNAVIEEVKSIEKLAADRGFEVAIQDLEGRPASPDSLRFDAPRTDLSFLLEKTREDYAGQNLTDAILISDGIVNKGLSPEYQNYPFKIHSLGLGDSVPHRDLKVKNVVSNRVALMGNSFPIQADILSNGLKGRAGIARLLYRGKTLATKRIGVNKEEDFEQIVFDTKAVAKGIQRYTIRVDSLSGETTTRNNRQDVYVDVIDGRRRILLLAMAPHPDIKALRAIIEQNENYEVDVRVLSEISGTPKLPNAPYDLAILHQIPNQSGFGRTLLAQLSAKETPLFFVLGPQTLLSEFNSANTLLRISAPNARHDRVSGALNPTLQSINLDADQLAVLDKLPPITVPYGAYSLSQGSEVVLFQQVGSVITQKPLLILGNNEEKTAVLAGEGLWLWRQGEFARMQTHEAVDNLIAKVIQFLTISEDKRKFRVYPSNPEFDQNQSVSFETEAYNAAYDKIFGQNVTLIISDESGRKKEFDYVNLAEKPRFEVGELPNGVYRFTASAMLGGAKESVSGQFTIHSTDWEAMNTQADFDLLRQLSTKSGGKFFTLENAGLMHDALAKLTPKSRISAKEELTEMINLKWIFFVFLLLASLEWALRKYFGGY